MTDPGASAFLQQSLALAGLPVTLQRVSGEAPNVTTTFACTINAVVRNLIADTTATAQSGLSAASMGAIEQADRTAIVSALDLTAAGFPLPVARGDQVILPDSAEILNVLRVDAYTRRYQGGIVLTVVGVS